MSAASPSALAPIEGHRPPPRVPGNEPSSTWAALKRELAPRPGRAVNSLRLVATTLIIVAVCEALRIPNAATAAYMAFIIFKSDADATIPLAILGGCAILFGILVSIVYFAATLSEPALRIPLMALIAFGAVFLSRASTLGVAAFASGLFTVISLTKGDDLLSGDLSPYNDSDVERFGLPSLFYMSPEEALVHNLLWLALAVAVAVAVILLVNRLTRPDPECKLRVALAERLDTMASFCAGEEAARHRLGGYARQGMAALTAQNALAGKLKHGGYRPAFGSGVIAVLWELILLLLAFGRLPTEERRSTVLSAAAPFLSAAAAAIRDGTAFAADIPSGSKEEGDARASPEHGATAHEMLETRLLEGLAALRGAIGTSAPESPKGTLGGLLKPDAFTNLAYRRFAFKVTLAMMACYLFMNLADWSSISTCITTCFVVALDGFGQSIHKMLLRVSGALAGAAVGFGYILFVMPALTDIGQLLAVMAPVLLLGAWIRTGGERTSYFGQQMAFAFMLMLVQDYGPTLHFQTGRDRIIGILVGEAAFCAVFLHVWPMRVGDVVRQGTASALDRLAAALKEGGRTAGTKTVGAFAEALGKVLEVLADDRYEPGGVRSRTPGPVIDADVVARLQALAIPVSILASEQHHEESGKHGSFEIYLTETSDWLRRLAKWITGEADAENLAASLPHPPSALDRGVTAARIVWCQALDGELREVLALLYRRPM